ncbi:hypothetical protein M0812_00349 [Anaeramoeba flamelloides]|uniref:Uncharacterized protein n=1 Tax=Anaeramoeba flamelloides TaxID=1746091 RepID=A0AAV8A393_9EUKA|nr:hypothetical protein M0812_00349 [Anaeramoeba flamelloides]
MNSPSAKNKKKTKKEPLLPKKRQDLNTLNKEPNNFFLKNETVHQQTQNPKIGDYNFPSSSNFEDFTRSPSNNFLLTDDNSFNQNDQNQFKEQEQEIDQELGTSKEQLLPQLKEKEKEKEQEQEQEQISFFEPINWGMNLNLDLDFDMGLDNNLDFGFEPQTELNELNLLNMKEDHIIKFSNLTQLPQKILSEQDEKNQDQKSDRLQLQPQASQPKTKQRIQQPKAFQSQQIQKDKQN